MSADRRGGLRNGGCAELREREGFRPVLAAGVTLWMTLSLWCVAATAAAQSVFVLVPPALEHGASAEDAEFALEVIADRLRSDGYNVISHGQAASAMAALAEEGESLPTSPHECTSLECAAGFRSFFDAEAAVRLRVSTEGAEGERLAVTLVESEDAQWTGSSELTEGFEFAALHSLAVARRRRAERRGPWLTVEGTPRGAEVRVDGRPVGTLPFDGRFSPGEHQVEVRSDVYVSERRTVRLPLSAWGERRVHLSVGEGEGEPLLAAPAAPAVDEAQPEEEEPAEELLAPERRGTATWDYVVGGAMIAGGLALGVIVPAMNKARAGECSNGSSDLTSCPKVYDVKGVTWGQFAAGLALMGGGAAVVATRPIQLMVGGDRRSASVGVRGSF